MLANCVAPVTYTSSNLRDRMRFSGKGFNFSDVNMTLTSFQHLFTFWLFNTWVPFKAANICFGNEDTFSVSIFHWVGFNTPSVKSDFCETDQRRAPMDSMCGPYRGMSDWLVHYIFRHEHLHFIATSGTFFSGWTYCSWIKGRCRRDEGPDVFPLYVTFTLCPFVCPCVVESSPGNRSQIVRFRTDITFYRIHMLVHYDASKNCSKSHSQNRSQANNSHWEVIRKRNFVLLQHMLQLANHLLANRLINRSDQSVSWI